MTMDRTRAWSLALLLAGLPACGESPPAETPTANPPTSREAVAETEPAPTGSREEFESLLQLATAAASDGRNELAAQSFEQALAESRRLGDPKRQAHANGLYGLFLSENGRVDDAQEQLESAVTVSRAAGDRALVARCQLELGIFCQHQNQFPTARQLLTSACAALDPQAADALIARAHLAALTANQACACGEQGRALVDALRQQIITAAPADLVSDVVVDFTPEAGFQVECDTRRKPTADEAAQLARIVSQARAAYRARVRPPALRR